VLDARAKGGNRSSWTATAWALVKIKKLSRADATSITKEFQQIAQKHFEQIT
jgi:hypothetical protein